MDPWSAVQCASVVVGFVDLAGRVVAGTYKSYTGASELRSKAKELEDVRKRVGALRKDAKDNKARRRGHKSGVYEEFDNLCAECENAIDSILTIINKVCENGESNPSIWSSLKESVGSLWNKKDIEAIQAKLEKYQQQLPTLMIGIISSEQAASAGVVLDIHAIVQRMDEKFALLAHGQPRGGYPDDNFVDYLLVNLRYQEMHDRANRIHPAHDRTARWIFDRYNNEHNFVQWMEEEDSDIFWITGKPGSGKSTLMKFIIDAQDTSSSLQRWAGDRPLLILSCYFWISGSEMQQSKAGFLRQLLYQAIEKHPEFAFKVFEKTLRVYRILGPFPCRWADDELEELLCILLQMAQNTMRVAVFVDGLDEYGGKSEEIIELLHKIQVGSSPLNHKANDISADLKLCVSSREWTAFRARFSCKPKLRMEMLNGPDINSYVADKLSQHERFESIISGPELIDKIQKQAEGVFLWAYVATTMVYTGLNQGDDSERLHHLIDGLPSELSDLFDRILETVEEDKFREASQLLQIVLAALPWAPGAMELLYALSDPEVIYKLPIQELTEKERRERILQVEYMVTARTKCLLKSENLPGDSGLSPMEFGIPYFEFIHRTVGDYLKQPTVQQRLTEATKPTKSHPEIFNAHERLALAQLARIKTCFPRSMGEHVNWVCCGINYMILAHPGDGSDGRSVRDRFVKESTSTILTISDSHKWPAWRENEKKLRSSLASLLGFESVSFGGNWTAPCWHNECCEKAFPLDIAARLGLDDFVHANLNQVPSRCRKAWGVHLFALASVQNRYYQSTPEYDRQEWSYRYLKFADTYFTKDDMDLGKQKYNKWRRGNWWIYRYFSWFR